jgi:hypothetical protein
MFGEIKLDRNKEHIILKRSANMFDVNFQKCVKITL